MKTPLDAVAEIALEIAAEAACAAARLAVVMVAVTEMELAAMDRAMSAASSPVAVARAAM